MKKLLTLIAIAGLFASCSNMSKKNEGGDMASNDMAANNMTSKNEARVQEFYDKVFNAHNPDIIDSYCTADFVDHQPGPGHSGKGIDDLKADFREWFAMMPDVHNKIEMITSQGDKVWVKFSFTGTNTGPMGPNMPATGKSVNVEGMEMIAFNKDGKATERWGYHDHLKFMKDLGMMDENGNMIDHKNMAEQGKMEKEGKKMDKEMEKMMLINYPKLDKYYEEPKTCDHRENTIES